MIYLSVETQNILRDLAKNHNTRVTEIIRRGIGVMQFDRELKRGDRLLIEAVSGKLRRVLFPRAT